MPYKKIVVEPERVIPAVIKEIEVGPGWLRAWYDGGSGNPKWYDNRAMLPDGRRHLDKHQDPTYMPDTRSAWKSEFDVRAYVYIPPDVSPAAVLEALNAVKKS